MAEMIYQVLNLAFNCHNHNHILVYTLSRLHTFSPTHLLVDYLLHLKHAISRTHLQTNNVSTHSNPTPLLLPPHPPRTPHARALSPRKPITNSSLNPISILLFHTITITITNITHHTFTNLIITYCDITRNNRTNRTIPKSATEIHYFSGTI